MTINLVTTKSISVFNLLLCVPWYVSRFHLASWVCQVSIDELQINGIQEIIRIITAGCGGTKYVESAES